MLAAFNIYFWVKRPYADQLINLQESMLGSFVVSGWGGCSCSLGLAVCRAQCLQCYVARLPLPAFSIQLGANSSHTPFRFGAGVIDMLVLLSGFAFQRVLNPNNLSQVNVTNGLDIALIVLVLLSGVVIVVRARVV